MEEQTLQPNPQPSASAPQADIGQQVPDVSPGDRAKHHYTDVLGNLVEEALINKTVPVLANTMSFYLAWIFVEYGPVAAGHVFERLGANISYFVERNQAEREAREAREAGKVSH